MSAIRISKNFVAPSTINPSQMRMIAAKKQLQRTIYRTSAYGWAVDYRILPDRKWINAYRGTNEVEAKEIYKNLKTLSKHVSSGLLQNPRKRRARNLPYINLEQLLSNPAHHFPKTEKGRPGSAKYSRQLEEVFPGMRKGRPRINAHWKVDLFSEAGFIDSILGQGTQKSAMAEAASFVGKIYNNIPIARVVLNGPYADIDAMEADITEDEETPVTRHATPPPKPRGRPPKIKLIPISQIPQELAQPKRKRGRPRKHVESRKFKLGQQVQDKNTGKIGIITDLVSGTKELGWGYHINFNGVLLGKYESELKGLRGRPRKSDIHSAITIRPNASGNQKQLLAKAQKLELKGQIKKANKLYQQVARLDLL